MLIKNLRSEKEILDSWNGNNDEIMVSICCLAYNHEEFIKDALNSFLIQETTFPFEILIHDDASTDNTASIIQSYVDVYPNIIKPIFQSENKYSKGVNVSLDYLYLASKGKYIAICEGDDYWCDKQKLAKQVDFLNTNSDYIACYHNVEVIGFDNKSLDFPLYSKFESHEFNKDWVHTFKLPGQLASLMFKNFWPDLDNYSIDCYRECKTNGDQKLALMLIMQGKIFCSEDVMAVHRKIFVGGTSWTAMNYNKNLCYHSYRSIIALNKLARLVFNENLKNKELRFKVVLKSIYLILRKPSIENLKVFVNISKIFEENKFEFIAYAFKNFIKITNYKK